MEEAYKWKIVNEDRENSIAVLDFWHTNDENRRERFFSKYFVKEFLISNPKSRYWRLRKSYYVKKVLEVILYLLIFSIYLTMQM